MQASKRKREDENSKEQSTAKVKDDWSVPYQDRVPTWCQAEPWGVSITENFDAVDFKKHSARVKRTVSASLWRVADEKSVSSAFGKLVWIKMTDACRLGGQEEEKAQRESRPSSAAFPDYAVLWDTTSGNLGLFVPLTSFISRLAFSWSPLTAKRKRDLMHRCENIHTRLLTGKPASHAKQPDVREEAQGHSGGTGGTGSEEEGVLYHAAAKKFKQQEQHAEANAAKFDDFMKAPNAHK